MRQRQRLHFAVVAAVAATLAVGAAVVVAVAVMAAVVEWLTQFSLPAHCVNHVRSMCHSQVWRCKRTKENHEFNEIRFILANRCAFLFEK